MPPFSARLGKSQRLWCPRPEVLCLPQIPKPLHGTNPRSILGAKWWTETRQKAYESTDYHCIACCVHKSCAQYRKWLEAHEVYDTDYLLGKLVYVETVPLCVACHQYIHIGRLQALLEQGRITQQRYVSIIQHGDRVLAQAGLVKPKLYEGPMAEWADWRLVIDGKEYEPRFKTPLEWLEYHAKADAVDET